MNRISKVINDASLHFEFEPYGWIREAIACGLLTDIEDADIDALVELDEVGQGEEWSQRLALGMENPSEELLKLIESMDLAEEEEEEDGDGIIKPQTSQRKRRISPVSEEESRPLKKFRRQEIVQEWKGRPRGPKYLSPLWVIIANCLFENGMCYEISRLHKLIDSQEELNFTPKVFLRRWLWIKWLGKKHCLEILLKPIFSCDGDADEKMAGEEMNGKLKLSFEEDVKELCLCFNSVSVISFPFYLKIRLM